MRLLVETKFQAQVFDKSQVLIIGREISADIQIANARISRQHLVISHEKGFWAFKDLDSANGTFEGSKRVQEGPITSGLGLNLGGDHGEEVRFTLLAAHDRHDTNTYPNVSQERKNSAKEVSRYSTDFRFSLLPRVRIGKSSLNDIVIDDSMVSSAHAEINLSSNGNYSIHDLGTNIGVYVNGRRTRRQTLSSGDTLEIGSIRLQFTGSTLETLRSQKEDSLSVRSLTLEVGKKEVVKNISLEFKPASLTAILGPSGAGKSTLLSGITCQTPAKRGEITFGPWSLTSQYDQVRHRIGVVPQNDILHSTLSTRQALEFAAKLRLPRDVTRSSIEERINDVLAQLELEAKADLKISHLSGGQKKRASVALELLTGPDLLFLDEPTSGLDPALDRQTMKILRALANRGKTVVVVTHSTDNLDLTDDIVLMRSGGTLAYFGSPMSAFQAFKVDSWPEVFENLMQGENKSNTRTELITKSELGKNPVKKKIVLGPADWFYKLLILVKRNLTVMTSDVAFFGFLLSLPFLLAGVGFLAGSEFGLSVGPPEMGGLNASARSLVLVMILAGVFIGTSSSVQELVKERDIFAREKSVGLSTSAYILSKVIVLTGLVVFQVSVFTSITLWGRPLPQSGILLDKLVLLEVTIAMVALGLVSMSIGLFVSSIVSTREQTMPLLVGITMLQVVFSGSVPLSDTAYFETVSNAIPAFWSTNMLASSIDLNGVSFLNPPDYYSFWDASTATWARSMTILLVFFIASIVATTAKSTQVSAKR